MPLQIRRGTDAERLAMTVPLAQGELLYVTDDQRLYIGTGASLGGVQITGYTDEDAQDATAPMFTGGVHSGIAFTYNDTANRIDAVVDLSNYTGVIKASAFKGSVFADDGSTFGGIELVNAVDGTIYLDGTVSSNIVPTANEAYDIGSASFRFRDLYLSGTSLHLGSAIITSSGSAVQLPAGSTVGGAIIGAANDGVIEGSSYRINIVSNDGSTIILNNDTETVTASGGIIGNLTGDVVGNLTGNVIGNVSGNVSGDVTGDIYTSMIISADSSTINIGSSIAVRNNITVENYIILDGKVADLGDGVETSAIVEIYVSSTDDDNLKVLENGPLYIHALKAHNGTTFVDAGGLAFTTEGTITTGATSIPTTLRVFLADGAAGLDTSPGQFSFNNTGAFIAPIVQTGSYTSTERDALIPAVGMMIYNTTANKFQGYQNTGGTTPEWVDLS